MKLHRLLLLASLFACAPLPGHAAPAETPSARELLARVRANQAGQERNLSGQLRMSSSSGKIVIPFRLLLRGGTIVYQFSDPSEALILHLDDKGSRLERATGTGKSEKITGAKLDEPVRGTDISFEDLSLKFLYWNNAVVEPKLETLKTRDCWIVRAVPSRKDESQYDMARLWIEPTGGLLKAECYLKGKLVRLFSVSSVQRAEEGGGYILKSMTVQRMDTEGKKDHYPTYLEVKQD